MFRFTIRHISGVRRLIFIRGRLSFIQESISAGVGV
jgi:hypothetical protein